MPRVVEPGHSHSDQPGATQREDIVGGVVQQDPDVGRPTRVEPGTEQSGETLRFGEELAMGPDLISEAKGWAIGEECIETIPPEEGGGIRGREGHLGQWRSNAGCASPGIAAAAVCLSFGYPVPASRPSQGRSPFTVAPGSARWRARHRSTSTPSPGSRLGARARAMPS